MEMLDKLNREMFMNLTLLKFYSNLLFKLKLLIEKC